jgi:hypothetical protein
MRILRKLLASFLVYLTVSIAILGALIMSLLNTYLNQEFYQSEFFGSVVYEQVSTLILNEVENQYPEATDYLSTDEIKEQLGILIPSDVLSDSIESIFNQLGGDQIPEELSISLEPVKNKLPDAVEELLPIINEKIPDEIPVVALEFQLKEIIETQMPSQLQVPLSDIRSQLSDKQNARLEWALTSGRDQIPYILLGSIILLLMLLPLVAWKPVGKAIAWDGTAMLLSGGLTMFTTHSFEFAFTTLLEQLDVDPLIISPIINEMTFFGFTMLGAAAIFYVLAFLFREKKEPKIEKYHETEKKPKKA